MPGYVCPSCGYDLRAQITQWGARCPECGCGFTAEELEHLGRPWPWRPIARFAAVVLLPPILVVAMIWFGLVTWWEDAPDWYAALFWAVLGGTAVAHQLLAMKWCSRNNWPYLFGSFIGVALTLTSVGAFFLFLLLIMFVIGTLYGW